MSKLQKWLKILEKIRHTLPFNLDKRKFFTTCKYSQFTIYKQAKTFIFFSFHVQKYFRGIPPCSHHNTNHLPPNFAFFRLLVCLVFAYAKSSSSPYFFFFQILIQVAYIAVFLVCFNLHNLYDLAYLRFIYLSVQ